MDLSLMVPFMFPSRGEDVFNTCLWGLPLSDLISPGIEFIPLTSMTSNS